MKIRITVVVLALALVAVGCGTRVKEDTVAMGNGVLGGVPGENASKGGSGGFSNTGPSTSATPGGAASTPATAPVEMFGGIENPCGPATKGPNKASDKFVTESQIDVTTIADPGGPKPGLNQGVFDSMEAFATWCNSFGGIHGRKLKVSLKDAGIVKYKEMVAEACADSFALVGGIGTFDQGGAQDAVDCGLVNVPAAAVSAEQTGADRTYQPLPNLPNSYSVGSGRWVKDTFPGVADKASTLYSKFSITESQSNKLVEAYEQLGYKFIYRQSANINETNWGPLVVSMKNQGVKYTTLTSSFEEIIPLQKEMANQNYHPEITELEANFYNQKYPEQASQQGADTTGTYVKVTIWPFEEKDQKPAMKQYLDILTKTKPDAIPELLGVQAFSAGLLFATAAKNLGPDLTRDGLMAELKKIHAWDAGGLHGVSDPGGHVATTCFVMMKVEGSGFKRAFPLPDKDKAIYDKGNGWSCPEDGRVDLKGDYGTGAKEKAK